MNIKSYIVSKGDGKFCVVCGDVSDQGFMDSLEGKEYFERVPDVPLVEDDPHGHFYEAYEMEKGRIIINMQKAKQGYLDWMRELREIKLQDLDLEQVKALGKLDFDKIKEIEATKESLRDLPDLIDWDSIETIYDLMHVFPPILQ